MCGAIAKDMGLSGTIFVVVCASFITYRIFKRFEPDKPPMVGFLLIVIPTLLAPALHCHIRSLTLAVGIAFTLHYVLILVYVTTYRLSPFHPLAKYPGPIKNKLSKLTMSYISLTGKQHTYYRNLHRRYGDIVRTGPNELSVNSVDAVQPVLGAAGLPKGPFWYNRGPDGVPETVVGTRDPFEHKRRRKTWDRGFGTAAIRNYEEIVVKKARELLEQFEKRAGHEIDLSMWMSYFSYDFMSDMAFGINFDMMRTGYDSTGVRKAVEGELILTAIMAHIPWLFTYLRLFPVIKIRQRLFDLVATYMNRRLAEGSNIKDLMYYLTDEEGLEPVKPTMPTIHSDGLVAVVGGSDTVATPLTGLWYYLLLEPAKLKRLQNEVDIYFPGGEEPLDVTRMANMPYLNACINEVLRLLPPVISGSQRSVKTGSGGRNVGPYFIPEGNQVLNHTLSLHRNPRYFSPYPDTFWPDRWLPERDREELPSNETFILNHAAYIPFSYGPANCVGKNVALLEMRAVTCYVVQKFMFKVKEGFRIDTWEEGIGDFFLVKSPALPVVVETRHQLL
ncbi:hypothetical protein PILCRDRAFT_829164 [Piloderma croceum F 1598]|uniref:High nitrogen upregulated cytochrome P450 monooxygenase 2 n=1 Tax=Piloderma croceum (strain F 1598) TaxID=765440 RepID=A0A0C3ELG3_PILCF|nr:hypothetical protein PILCRDRAFT_829164 [Piloderma croceum F 1598]